MYSLVNADCLGYLKEVKPKSVDLILTDLPYQQTARNHWDVAIPFGDFVVETIKGTKKVMEREEFYQNSFSSGVSFEDAKSFFDEHKQPGLWSHYKEVAKENAAIVLFANGMFTANMMKSNEKMWRYNLVWEKTQPTGFQNANRMPMRSHEDICVFYQKQPVYHPQKTIGHKRKVSSASHKANCKDSTNYNVIEKVGYDSTERFPRSVWKYAKDSQRSALHPTQKPVALLEELIKTYTDEGGLVLDSCAGSMSTAIAAINTGRGFLCIEKDRKIFETGRQRVERRLAG